MPYRRETAVKDGLKENLDEPIPFVYSITSYGADYPVDGLIKRLNSGDIYIPTFQRGYVWTLKQASRFIESLLLGLPVPGIFLSRDEDTKKLIVIDGQQRLRTLQYFYDGIFERTGKIFKLTDIDSQYLNIAYKVLNENDRRRLDDSLIHATIVRQERPSDDNSSIFNIFERLNTGGSLLHPQEIRNAIYQGELNDLVVRLNNNVYWRKIYGPVSLRMRDQELILRFLALYFDWENYKPPMKGFLNTFMGENRHLMIHPENEIASLFNTTIDIVCHFIGGDAFKPKRTFIAAFFDAIMIGLALRLSKGSISESAKLKQRYLSLIENKDFLDAASTHTSDEDNVFQRITLAIATFSDLK